MAFIFVVTFIRNGIGWTPRYTLSAFFIPKDEAIFFVVAVLPFARGQFQKGDNASYSDGHPFGSDETVIETEGSKTAGISNMAL